MLILENVEKQESTPEINLEGVTPFDFQSDTEAALTDIVFESTIALQNLELKMAKLEHVAVVKEDVEMLEEGVKDFWEKVKAVIAKVIASIKAFFAKIWTKIVAAWDKMVSTVKELAEKVSDKSKSVKTKLMAKVTKADKIEELCRKLNDKSIEIAFNDEQIKTQKDEIDALKKEIEAVKAEGEKEAEMKAGDVAKVALGLLNNNKRIEDYKSLIAKSEARLAAAYKTKVDGTQAKTFVKGGKAIATVETAKIAKYKDGLAAAQSAASAAVTALREAAAGASKSGFAKVNEDADPATSILDQF